MEIYKWILHISPMDIMIISNPIFSWFQFLTNQVTKFFTVKLWVSIWHSKHVYAFHIPETNLNFTFIWVVCFQYYLKKQGCHSSMILHSAMSHRNLKNDKASCPFNSFFPKNLLVFLFYNIFLIYFPKGTMAYIWQHLINAWKVELNAKQSKNSIRNSFSIQTSFSHFCKFLSLTLIP